ncbi:MAG: hypothetical protein R2705_13485 [Ilumatobacteraceae bacterium]
MKLPEWEVLSDPSAAPNGEDFMVTMGDVPTGYHVLGTDDPRRQDREVNALIGFTRLEAPKN